MSDTMDALRRLKKRLERFDRLAIAVSGGVDSLTLARVASTVNALDVLVIHACGPAVPPEATERVKRHAEQAGWDLRIADAGEYADPEYRRNPVNRCFFCKTNLYSRIRSISDAPIASGTNLDDLDEFRPGLTAAAAYEVSHPFVEAGIDKSTVRRIAARLGLDDIAELPAQPCLASRVETGIPINANDLAFIGRVEARVAALLGPGDIRCRLSADGVHLELPELALRTGAISTASLDALLVTLCADEDRRYAGRRPYRRGGAFLTDQSGNQAA